MALRRLMLYVSSVVNICVFTVGDVGGRPSIYFCAFSCLLPYLLKLLSVSALVKKLLLFISVDMTLQNHLIKAVPQLFCYY